jgi:Zn-dependent M16 (insulinase) family peptidase
LASLSKLYESIQFLDQPVVNQKHDFTQSAETLNHSVDLGVNYASQSFAGVPYNHQDAPVLSVYCN